MVGDSDTFPSDVGNANFPDYLSASRSGAAGVSSCKQSKPRSWPTANLRPELFTKLVKVFESAIERMLQGKEVFPVFRSARRSLVVHRSSL
jgi:hypothetical protein